MKKVTVHNSFKPEPLIGKDWDNTLKKGCGVLQDLGLKYWLSAGTLLGIYRDGKVIDHDTDLDVEVLYTEELDYMNIINRMPFKLIRSIFDDSVPIQLAFVDETNNIIFDIYFFKEDEELLSSSTDCGKLIYPRYKFEILSKIWDFPCPDPKWYCEYRYGPDWNIPKTFKGAWVKDAANIIKS